MKPRTLLTILVFFILSLLAVHFIGAQWMMVYLSLFFLFMGSVFAWLYLDFSHHVEIKQWKSWPLVTVLVPAYNEQDTIEECVAAIKNFDYPQDKLQIIVINDASTDTTAEIVKGISGVTLIDKKKNGGKAAGLNDGLRKTKGEFVAAIDADTYPAPDALRKMIESFSDENIGAVTGLIQVNKPHNMLMRIQEIEYLVGFGFYQSMLSIVNAAFVTPGPMCVYRKTVMDELGGYDEENITEDMEIALHVQHEGYRIKACHTANIYTDVPDNWKEWWGQRLRWYRGKIFNTNKYKEMLFNPRFGDLGIFSLPFTFLLEIVSIFALFLIAVLILQNLFLWAQTVYALAAVAAVPTLKLDVLISSSAFFTYAILSVFFLMSFVLSHRIGKKKITIKKLVPVISILFFYSSIVAGVWLMSLFKEIEGSEKVW
jgi:poly-beta-1,6-N-acetyl-D-glucosamine synthase